MNDHIEDLIALPAGHVHALDLLMKLSARDIVYAAPLLLLALWFWPAQDRALNQRVAVVTCIAVGVSLLAAMALGHIHHEARPFVSDADARLLINHSADNSFPSDHAALAFAVAGAIVWWRRGIGLACLGLALLTGVARVYVGVHWPLDILASAVAGVTAGALLTKAVPLLEAPQRWFARLLPAGLASPPLTSH